VRLKPCSFCKDGTSNRRRGTGVRKLAGLRRRTRVGGADGARGHAGAAAAGGEEHHVRYICQSAGRPRFDIWERVLDVFGYAVDGPGTSHTIRCVWRRAFTDGGAIDIGEPEPAGRSSGAVLDSLHPCFFFVGHEKRISDLGYCIIENSLFAYTQASAVVHMHHYPHS
jgi:hypothetical protein